MGYWFTRAEVQQEREGGKRGRDCSQTGLQPAWGWDRWPSLYGSPGKGLARSQKGYNQLSNHNKLVAMLNKL